MYLSFILDYLRRTLRRPPVALFLVLLLGSCLGSYGVMYYTLTAHQSVDREGYLRLEKEGLAIEFPSSWIAAKAEYENESGSFHGVEAFCAHASFYLGIHDERYTQFLTGRFNLTDAFSVVLYIVNQSYTGILEQNQNATLHFIENNTVGMMDMEVSVLHRDAEYTKVIMRGSPDNQGVLHNVTAIVMAEIVELKLTVVGMYSLEERWDEVQGTFETILNSVEIRR